MHDHTLRAPVSLGADKGNDDRPHSYGRAKPLFSCATALIAIAYLIHTAPTAARVPYDSVFECAPPPLASHLRTHGCIHQHERAHHTAAASRPRSTTNGRCGPPPCPHPNANANPNSSFLACRPNLPLSLKSLDAGARPDHGDLSPSEIEARGLLPKP